MEPQPNPPPSGTRPRLSDSNRRLLIGAIMGLLYGVVLQLAVRGALFRDYFELMSIGMIFILPVAIGFLVVFLAAREEPRSVAFALFAPAPTIGMCLLLALLVGWEGGFCMLFAAPVFLVMAALGGLLALGVSRLGRRGVSGTPLAVLVLLLPMTSGFVESNIRPADSLRRVHTVIPIQASPGTVWSEIIEVRRIGDAEQQSGLFYRLGFPKPIEATLSHQGVGGVRHALFQKGLLFIETIDEWLPGKRISFSIKPDAHQTRLDPHVVVGGQYFDVLRGTYEIEAVPGGVVLHLESRFRISTHFNAYAGFLGDTLMRDIQESILRVLKRRCEAR